MRTHRPAKVGRVPEQAKRAQKPDIDTDVLAISQDVGVLPPVGPRPTFVSKTESYSDNHSNRMATAYYKDMSDPAMNSNTTGIADGRSGQPAQDNARHGDSLKL